MLAVAYEKADGSYMRYLTVHEIDEETISRAQNIFYDYKKRGIILNESFDDMVWLLSNQKKHVSLNLSISKETYDANALNWIGCKYNCYQECVKAYITFILGEIELVGLQAICNTFRNITDRSIDEVTAMSKHINHVVGLLRVIPGSSACRDYVTEELEEKISQRSWKNQNGKQRYLADFNTYLKFNEILNAFWAVATESQKLFYFPLYFWWNLTAILPLRVTEFLLTPRDCLDIGDEGENVLTVRRTRLKGGFKKVAYRITEDYEYKKYIINESLSAELRSYIKATDKMRKTEISTLFLQSPHFKYVGRKVPFKSRYYNYDNLRICLAFFYQEVVALTDNIELDVLNLGDTRHLAMTNLIISGGSPVICKELAGHLDIDVSSHYYSNISYLVECVTLERYRKSKGTSAEIVGNPKYTFSLPESRYRLSDGWCDASAIKSGDISECLKVADKQGQIGNCACCIHFWPDEQGIRMKFFDDKIGKQEVDADCHYLMRMIESVRKGLGYSEDIGAALFRLQRSSDHYGKCLWEKYTKAGEQ